jgi:hypothetical protein
MKVRIEGAQMAVMTDTRRSSDARRGTSQEARTEGIGMRGRIGSFTNNPGRAHGNSRFGCSMLRRAPCPRPGPAFEVRMDFPVAGDIGSAYIQNFWNFVTASLTAKLLQHLLVAKIGRLLVHQFPSQEDVVRDSQYDQPNTLFLILEVETVFAVTGLGYDSDIPKLKYEIIQVASFNAKPDPRH